MQVRRSLEEKVTTGKCNQTLYPTSITSHSNHLPSALKCLNDGHLVLWCRPCEYTDRANPFLELGFRHLINRLAS